MEASRRVPSLTPDLYDGNTAAGLVRLPPQHIRTVYKEVAASYRRPRVGEVPDGGGIP